MIRLLIVDDEYTILQGLHSYFENNPIEDAEILTACSAAEAIMWLDSVKVDVVLSDINMPEMDGLTLLKEIEERWPKCKVIFLTGYDQFDYIQRAFRSNCVTNYLMKTEGMKKISEAVMVTIRMIKEEQNVRNQKEWLQQKLPKAILRLQRKTLLGLLHPDSYQDTDLQTELETVKLPLRTSDKLYLGLLRVEQWGKFASSADRELIGYAISNIAEEKLGPNVSAKCVPYDGDLLVCFCQTKVSERLLTARFESIQPVCKDLLGVSCSILFNSSSVFIPDVHAEFSRMRLHLPERSPEGIERMVTLEAAPPESAKDTDMIVNRQTAEFYLNQMKEELLRGHRPNWLEWYGKFAGLYDPQTGPPDLLDKVALIHQLCQAVLRTLESMGLKDEAVKRTKLLDLLHFNGHTSWKQVLSSYADMMEWMMARHGEQWDSESAKLVGEVHYYIHNHLSGDLSLTRVAREVYMNPSYFSRWYKQTTGQSISDYIANIKWERSRELLATTSLKAQEIAERLGFSDQHYFFRFFKKMEGCTTQEFRAAIRDGKK